LNSILFSMKATAHHRDSIRALGASRKDRFSIAALACWALLFLCGSPWLAADWAGKDDIEIFIKERNRDGVVSRALSCISFIDSWCFGTQKSWRLALYWYKGQR
jgi:hypothetical protein